MTSNEPRRLCDADIERLRALNRHLSIVEQQLCSLIEEKTQRPQRRPSAGTTLRIAEQYGYTLDVEKQAIVTFCLREDDPSYREDDDNILCEEKISLTWFNEMLADGDDHGRYCHMLCECGATAAIDPICYLFYHLCEEGESPTRRQLTISDVSLSGILCVRHTMLFERKRYAKQDEQEETGSGAADHPERAA